ncbi:hypothetical protein QZH41_018179 [Actinostola sp. cb2023]|nr:hypothetical protein QZH41_018179 [Actinostola sp. cb2023]
MDVRLIQPGRQGPTSCETDSVQTDSSRIPMSLEILKLKDVDQFIIRQNFQSEAWWDTVRFQVEDGRGKQILEIRQEKADNGCVQAILGKMRQYFMKVYYATRNEWIMEFEHPWSCSSPIFCPWASPSMIVRMPTGEVLGQVKNASRETCGSCLPPTKYFNVFNYDGSIINAVTGPTCYPFECTSSNPASFEVTLLKVENSGKTLRVGSIDHQWRGACGGLSSCCITEEQETVSLTCE